MPVIRTISEKDAVTVSGGNPFLVMCTRAAIYFIGLYLALLELEIDLFKYCFFGVIVFDSRYCNEADYQQYCKLIPTSNRPSFRGWRPVEIEGNVGTEVSIGVLLLILTRDEKLIIIPNNTIVHGYCKRQVWRRGHCKQKSCD